MPFSSDTSAPVHPAVLAAHRAANEGAAPSYGADGFTARLTERLKEVFETPDLAVSPAGSGTAANALLLSMLAPSHGAVLCHGLAHINTHERGAPEFFSGGAKLQLLSGPDARIDPESLRAALEARDPGFIHSCPAAAISLSNLTEGGTAYRPDTLRQLAGIAKAEGLRIHIDGARLANALAFTGASPADLTWRAGADALSFGLTKTGAMGAELAILFGDLAQRHGELEARRKRAGHMPAKARFVAAEALAMLEGGLWRDLAAHANAAAQRLSAGLAARPDVEMLHPVEGNLVFARMPQTALDRARDAGAGFYARQGAARFVCSWNTANAEIDRLLDALGPAERP